MMDCSVCPIHPQLAAEFPATARCAAETARSHGAEPVFSTSWANRTRPEMLEGLAEAYTRFAWQTVHEYMAQRSGN